jgi:hypothetical protein
MLQLTSMIEEILNNLGKEFPYLDIKIVQRPDTFNKLLVIEREKVIPLSYELLNSNPLFLMDTLVKMIEMSVDVKGISYLKRKEKEQWNSDYNNALRKINEEIKDEEEKWNSDYNNALYSLYKDEN